MSRRRVLLIGATGVFGSRLAGHLARLPALDLILTSRTADKAAALAAGLASNGARASVSGLAFDHAGDAAGRLARMSPWLVVDASGPFQGAAYETARTALTAGAHVVDLADARDYIMGYSGALDGLARTRGLVALTGASSTPALSSAAVGALTEGWQRIDTIDIAITPGGRSEVGHAVIAAILSYAGRPVPIWREGALQSTGGWCGSRRVEMPGLGRRWVAPVETVDAELLGRRHDVRSRVSFSAGLESKPEQFGMMLLARLRRAGRLRDLRPLAGTLLALRRLTRIITSDRGGMLVEASGLGPDGVPLTARWSLLAERGDGPHVPTLATAAAVQALLAGKLAPGARPASEALTLAEIETEMAPYAITTSRDEARLDRGLFEDAVGSDAFARLPIPLKALHRADGPPVWRGRAEIACGRGPVAWLVRRLIGMPDAGSDIPVTVTIERKAGNGLPRETWTRNFGGSRFTSQLSLQPDGSLRERFGATSFRLDIGCDAHGVRLPVGDPRLFGIPLPSLLTPRSDAREEVDEEGRFRFDVAVTLPYFGLLTHYRGWLTPLR